MLRVQVDLIQAKFPPVQVTVNEKVVEGEEMFEFDRRLGKKEWSAKK